MTTIAVQDETITMLRNLQKEWATKTHDETIRRLIAEKKQLKKSMWGALKHIKEEFVREEDDPNRYVG